MYSYAKLLIFSEINNYFDVFFKKSGKKFGCSRILPYLCCINLLRAMAKYNIQPKKEKTARYQTLLSEETKDRLRDEIIRLIVTERKYKDPEYNSKKLAEDLILTLVIFQLCVPLDSTRIILSWSMIIVLMMLCHFLLTSATLR